MIANYPAYIVVILCRCTYLSVNFDHGLAMARIYLVPAVCAQTDPGNIICGLITNIVLT